MGFWEGRGISQTTCDQSTPHSRQINMLTPHYLIFGGREGRGAFPVTKQYLSTESNFSIKEMYRLFSSAKFRNEKNFKNENEQWLKEVGWLIPDSMVLSTQNRIYSACRKVRRVPCILTTAVAMPPLTASQPPPSASSSLTSLILVTRPFFTFFSFSSSFFFFFASRSPSAVTLTTSQCS